MNRYIFTIRDVLWLTVVVGLGCALWIERGQSRPWRGRSEASFRALDEAGMSPQWFGGSILVHPLDAKVGKRYPKIYPAIEPNP